MDWQAVDALGNLGLAVGAASTGAWAVYSYRSKRRADAAQWMRELYNDFYTDAELLHYRRYLEYASWADELAPTVLLRVADRDVKLTEAEEKVIEGLDRVLNFLEQLLYLQDEGHVKRADLDVFFQYWFEKFDDDCNASLNQYLYFCGYERCADRGRATPARRLLIPDHSAVVAAGYAPGQIVDLDENREPLKSIEATLGYRADLRDAQEFRRRVVIVDADGAPCPPTWTYVT